MTSAALYEAMYGLGKPKLAVIQQTDSDRVIRSARNHRTINIDVPNYRIGRVVRHFKGRRYVISYSWFDVLNGFRP